MNCIDCEQVITCKLANEEIRKCDNFKNAHRKITKLKNVDYKKMTYKNYMVIEEKVIKEMQEKAYRKEMLE